MENMKNYIWTLENNIANTIWNAKEVQKTLILR